MKKRKFFNMIFKSTIILSDQGVCGFSSLSKIFQKLGIGTEQTSFSVPFSLFPLQGIIFSKIPYLP